MTSTGEPPAWALVRYLVGGLVAGVALGAGLPHFRGTLLSALTGAIVAASASGGPSGIARRLAVVAAGWSLVLTVVAFATAHDPVWAALAMAAVALLTSVAGAAGPLGAVLGFLLSLAYLLIAGISRTADLVAVVSVGWAAAHIAVGCVAGLLVAFASTAWRRRGEPDELKAARAPLPVAPILASLRSFDERARDGVRRAVPLAILMYLLQRNGSRDAFWIFFAAFLVLLTPGKTPASLASARVASTLFGVLVLAVASLIVPNEVLFSFGTIILFSGVGLSPPYPLIGGGLTTIGSVLMAGAPTGRSAPGRRTGCSTPSWAARSRWPPPTCSGRATGRRTRRRRWRPTRARLHPREVGRGRGRARCCASSLWSPVRTAESRAAH